MPVKLSKNRVTWSLATTGQEIEASAAANGSNDPHNLLESNAVEVTNWSSPTVSCRWHRHKLRNRFKTNGNETPTHSQSMTPSNREEEIKCHQSGESWPKCCHVTHHWDPGLERRRCPRQSQEAPRLESTKWPSWSFPWSHASLVSVSALNLVHVHLQPPRHTRPGCYCYAIHAVCKLASLSSSLPTSQGS